MAPISTLMRAARPALRFNPTSTSSTTSSTASRFFSSSSPRAQTQTPYTNIRNAWQRMRSGNAKGKRFQSTEATAAGTGASQQEISWFKKMLDSPVGLKTVHFWAPVMKWAIVVAGISDLARPASSLSLTQNLALTATGIIWTRWSLIIKPKNILLATVNFFLAVVGSVQVTRILLWQRSEEQKTQSEKLEGKAVEVKDKVVGAVTS